MEDETKIEIILNLERDPTNPRVVKVNGVTTVGRAETRRTLLGEARALVDAKLDELFPKAE
jgi:hypothetical protein